MQDAGGQPPSAALITLNQMGAQIATVKRRKKSTAAPDKKKMYEEVGSLFSPSVCKVCLFILSLY